MRKIIFFFMICISISAQTSEIFTFKSENGEEVYLPDAGSSWYVINVGDHKFKAKKAIVTNGIVKAPLPKIGVVEEIDIFGEHPDSLILWNSYFGVENNLKQGFTMASPIVAVNLRDSSINIYLEDLDIESVTYLNNIQEALNDDIYKLFFLDSNVTAIYNEFDSLTKGKTIYANGNSILDWLPEISQPDGPNASAIPPNKIGIYLDGIKNDNYMINYWLIGEKSKGKITLTAHTRLSDSTGTTIKYYSKELPNTTKVFYFEHWSARGEFIEYWKLVNPNKPLPSVLTPVAGIVIRVSMMYSEWGNNMIPDSKHIITRARFFEYAFPIGQVIETFIGEIN